uniref:Ribosomal protein 50S-L18Ae/60S-L20/60S-L18A domain-containing protein n=1 Tax=Sus scrofa TaxID=9823 RepID=A0A8D1ZRE9_PIG
EKQEASLREGYLVSQLKIKTSAVEIIYCGQVFQKYPLRVKNFGIWLCYDSLDLTTAGTITQCYRDMVLGTMPRAHSSQIKKVEEIAANKCLQPAVKQFQDSKIKFLLPYQVFCHLHKPCFTTKSPNTFF